MNVLSLCSGIGGLDLGLRLAVPEARTIAYCESDPFCRSVLEARIEEGHLDRAPIHPDLCTFVPAGGSDCIIAGFPCQPVSSVGRRQGEADERWLWPHVARCIASVRPRIVFMENVPGIAVLLGQILGDLAALRFDAEWDVFSAGARGAPPSTPPLVPGCPPRYAASLRAEPPAGGATASME